VDTGDVIQDFDGPDPTPNRRGHLLVISILLIAGVLAGYAAVSSPELRGPYATPRPSVAVVAAVRFTPAPFVRAEPAAAVAPSSGCILPGSVFTATVFVGGQLVPISRPVTPSTSESCAIVWLIKHGSLPYELFAR
jgi:hypothetical protein